MSITGSPARHWGDRSTKRLLLELELCAQRLLALNLVLIRGIDPGKATAGFIRSTLSIDSKEKTVRSRRAAIHTEPRAGRYCYGYPICSTILPDLCGALASMRCAWRASESGRIEPTRVVILPASNNVVSVCRRAVVTSA